MAIGFARVEFVKRSEGKNACAKAAYNLRGKVKFEGNCIYGPKEYDWSLKEPAIFHEILLPDHVNLEFKNPETLWNRVEQKEKRYNSQVAIELLLALPDNKEITLKHRITLAKEFVKMNFVNHGLGAQIDIHAPDKENHNWHAHVLITTRRFKKSGLGLEDHKARDLMPKISLGKVIEGADWGHLWAKAQNAFFEQLKLPLRVDKNGVVPQEHLGPVRMRGRAFDLLQEHFRLLEENRVQSQVPAYILESLVKKDNVFTIKDVEGFFSKHVPLDKHPKIKKAFWRQKQIIPLINKGFFTSLKQKQL